MNTWNDLNAKERAAFIKTAVRNGIGDLNVIKLRYNEFAEGGAAPTIEDTRVKPEIQISDNDLVNDSFSTHTDYVFGLKVLDRLKSMYGNNTLAAKMKLNQMQRMSRGFQRNPSRMHTDATESKAGNNQVYINPNDWSTALNGVNATTMHEYAGHIMYPNATLDSLNFSPEYARAFNSFGKNGQATANTIYNGTPGSGAEWSHDNSIEERIPFIKETLEDMRKAINPSTGLPYWDYTSDKPLDKATYEEYLKANPHARTLYWDNDNATFLLNSTAAIDKPKDDFLNMAAFGGGLSSPFSHQPIPSVRYADGGNLFAEGGPD